MRFLNKLFFLVSPILFFTFCISGCKGRPDVKQARPTPPAVVDVIVAKTTSVNNEVEANGTVLANEYVELHPEVSGRLTYLNIPEGTFVKQGTILARINDADLQAELAKTNVQATLAAQTEQRLKSLLDINGVNQADYDVALNQVNSLKADVAITQAAIDKTVIRAPFSGIIGLRQVSPGAYVSPDVIIATLQQVDKIKIDFTLPENYSNVIKKGSVVNVQVQESDNETRKAVVIAIEPQINQTTRNIKVRAVLQQGKANPGAFVKVSINASSNRSAIMIPTTSVIPDDINKQVILVKNGKAAFVTVITGLREANNVEVLKGINEGDSVVVTGVLFARDKSPVKVRHVNKQDAAAAGKEL